ncbi:MAG: GFA family protein [Archangiaceae bacterium]|nr:GFA family protein [Archangiaceae bacterium]
MSTHQGSCHCGAVTFSVDVELKGLTTCNCSMCGRTGAIMAFVPADKLKMLTGSDRLTDYQFGKKRIHHTFCSVCGVRPFAHGVAPDGSPSAMVNVRCLEGVDAHTLEVSTRYNGRAA